MAIEHESSNLEDDPFQDSSSLRSLLPKTLTVCKGASTLLEHGRRKSSRLKSRRLEYRREATGSSNQHSENQHVLPDTNNEHQVALQTPSNELRKQKASPRPRKRKNNNESQSLAGEGSFFLDADGRRSSRIKFRSLEYQRGERPLFGRIHDSASTIWEDVRRKSSRHGERPLLGRIHEKVSCPADTNKALKNQHEKIHSRKAKPWTSEEEKSLINAIEQHGGPCTTNWRSVRLTYPEFHERTVECLRRKYRRLQKRTLKEREETVVANNPEQQAFIGLEAKIFMKLNEPFMRYPDRF